MERLRSSLVGLMCLLLISNSAAEEANNPEFLMISNTPEIGRHNDLYIYAIARNYSDQDAEVVFAKPEALTSDVVKTGAITPPGSPFLGRYLQVKELKRNGGSRYGTYGASLIFKDADRMSVMSETFVKPETGLLDTGGVYTVTIYPEVQGGTALDCPVNIGVKQTSGCHKILWCMGKRRNVNRGPRFKLTSTGQAGLYTIYRPSRGQRGWFVQIRVIAASCPVGQYLDHINGCSVGMSCKNGGVLKDKENACICPPFFLGADCGGLVSVSVPEPCPAGWSFWGSHCYFGVVDALSWQVAFDRCVKLGSQLASIHSQEEEEFVSALFPNMPNGYVFFGLNDMDIAGTYVYTDDTEFDYENWDDDQPEVLTNNCPTIMIGGRWETASCSDGLSSVCKVPAIVPPTAPPEGKSFALAKNEDNLLLCSDLPGGNNKCRGYLICLGDNYGCKCSPGWWGNACNRPCAKGRYGANCDQWCPDRDSGCNRFFGPSSYHADEDDEGGDVN